MSAYQYPYMNYGSPSGQSNFGSVKSGTDIFGGASDQSNPFGSNPAQAQGTSANAITNAANALNNSGTGSNTTATPAPQTDAQKYGWTFQSTPLNYGDWTSGGGPGYYNNDPAAVTALGLPSSTAGWWSGSGPDVNGMNSQIDAYNKSLASFLATPDVASQRAAWNPGAIDTTFGSVTLSPDQLNYVRNLTGQQATAYENAMAFAQLESGAPGENPQISTPILPSKPYGGVTPGSFSYDTIVAPYTQAHSAYLQTPEGQAWTAQKSAAEAKATADALNYNSPEQVAAREGTRLEAEAAAKLAMPHTEYGVTYGVGGSQLPFLKKAQIDLLSKEQIQRLIQIANANGDPIAAQGTAQTMLNNIGTSRGFDSGTGVYAPAWSEDYQAQKSLYGFNWAPVINAGGGRYEPVIPPEQPYNERNYATL